MGVRIEEKEDMAVRIEEEEDMAVRIENSCSCLFGSDILKSPWHHVNRILNSKTL